MHSSGLLLEETLGGSSLGWLAGWLAKIRAAKRRLALKLGAQAVVLIIDKLNARPGSCIRSEPPRRRRRTPANH